MTAEGAHRGESTGFHVLLNRMADITDAVTFARDFERFEETFFCDLNQTLCFLADLANRRSERAVRLPSAKNQTAVNRHDLTLFKHSFL